MKTRASDGWSIILAGENSRCMQPFIKQWPNQDIPKQYCSLLLLRGAGHRFNIRWSGAITNHCEQKLGVISQGHKEVVIF